MPPPSNYSDMGGMELWLGPAGCGKTGKALALLREELDRDWRAIRYLVPTVGHKRSIEHLLLERSTRQGLFGDPVNIFYTFAQEVAQRGGVRGNQISELQKHLLLKDIIHDAELEYFARAARFPGFVQALGEAIDELKVHMVQSDNLFSAAITAEERGVAAFAQKLHELGALYARYQQQLIAEHLFDNEGIMWLAAERLREQHDLCPELRSLILDGFARLTPIQFHFLQALAPRMERVVLLFDYEDGRSATYHPVQASLDRLAAFEEINDTPTKLIPFSPCPTQDSALPIVRREIFRDRGRAVPTDRTVQLLIGATPAHEAEMIAREIRALLRDGKLADGTPVTPADIAIIARNAEQLRERFARTFQRFGLTLQQDPPLLAHTPVGRAVLAAFRLVRDRWKREDVLSLLKSGLLAIAPEVTYRVDIVARKHYLRDRQSSWLENWPDDDTREALQTALAPLIAFDAAYHHRVSTDFLTAIRQLVAVFRTQGLPVPSPLPDVHPEDAQRYVTMHAVFTSMEGMLDDLARLASLKGHFTADETVDVVTTALLRERLRPPSQPSEGIAMRAVHSTGGEKFAVVFLCQLLQGTFPRHQRESAFLMDHEREDALRDLNIVIDPRKHLEEDEQYWFLHALSSAKRQVVLSYPQHDMEGKPLEHSIFLDEVVKIVPDLRAHASTTSFRDVVPPLTGAESREEFIAGLAYGLRTAQDDVTRAELAAAYTGCPFTHGPNSTLAALFRRARDPLAELDTPDVQANLDTRHHPFSASEFQGYFDCPFSWFGAYCLHVQPVIEEFSPLDRGSILHRVLEQLYRRQQTAPRMPVHIEQHTFEQLWPQVESDLRGLLDQEPRFANRAAFLRDIEWEHLRRLMQRFLRSEIERARTRRAHPAYFERSFGDAHHAPLILSDETVTIRGTLDRIDLVDDTPGAALVVDYKSSASMSYDNLKSGKVVQASIYALALRRLFGLRPLGAEFIGLKEGEARGVYHPEIRDVYPEGRLSGALSAEEWDTLLGESEATLCEAARQMRDGHIALEPTTKRCADTCEYYPLCRGDRFTLRRKLRTPATAV